MTQIFEEVFRKLITFITESPFTWVREACSLLTAGANYHVLPFKSSVDVLEMALFALEVLEGSFFWLQTFPEESETVTGISAAIFIFDWECSMIKTLDTLDEESEKDIKGRLKFGESVHAFRCKISNQFWKNFGIESRKRFGIILIQSIRSSIFKEDKLGTNIASLCCLWVPEVLECLTQDQDEEQVLLDQFLSQGVSWPLWVMPNPSTGKGSYTLCTGNVTTDIHFESESTTVKGLDDKKERRSREKDSQSGSLPPYLSDPFHSPISERMIDRSKGGGDNFC